jgi:hypothetical protein
MAGTLRAGPAVERGRRCSVPIGPRRRHAGADRGGRATRRHRTVHRRLLVPLATAAVWWLSQLDDLLTVLVREERHLREAAGDRRRGGRPGRRRAGVEDDRAAPARPGRARRCGGLAPPLSLESHGSRSSAVLLFPWQTMRSGRPSSPATCPAGNPRLRRLLRRLLPCCVHARRQGPDGLSPSTVKSPPAPAAPSRRPRSAHGMVARATS